MGKPLKTLRRQFASQGWHLLFSFDNSISPGVIVQIYKPRDVNKRGTILNYPPLSDLEITGPVSIGLLEFSRSHELTLGAAGELLGVPKLEGKLKRARTVRLSLDNPVKYAIEDQIALASRLAGDPGWPRSAYARALSRKKHYLITDVVRTRIKYAFEGSGGLALEARNEGLGNLKSLRLDAGFRWENSYQLASKKDLVVAFEALQWMPKKGWFRVLKA